MWAHFWIWRAYNGMATAWYVCRAVPHCRIVSYTGPATVHVMIARKRHRLVTVPGRARLGVQVSQTGGSQGFRVDISQLKAAVTALREVADADRKTANKIDKVGGGKTKSDAFGRSSEAEDLKAKWEKSVDARADELRHLARQVEKLADGLDKAIKRYEESEEGNTKVIENSEKYGEVLDWALSYVFPHAVHY